mmetsp:Transcript_36878/g.66870  ORF Transcript_36878/g.66870 Transcript_36878/m.66870 type:complete len:967 (+) Transcript_36878:66-2966(+)
MDALTEEQLNQLAANAERTCVEADSEGTLSSYASVLNGLGNWLGRRIYLTHTLTEERYEVVSREFERLQQLRFQEQQRLQQQERQQQFHEASDDQNEEEFHTSSAIPEEELFLPASIREIMSYVEFVKFTHGTIHPNRPTMLKCAAVKYRELNGAPAFSEKEVKIFKKFSKGIKNQMSLAVNAGTRSINQKGRALKTEELPVLTMAAYRGVPFLNPPQLRQVGAESDPEESSDDEDDEDVWDEDRASGEPLPAVSVMWNRRLPNGELAPQPGAPPEPSLQAAQPVGEDSTRIEDDDEVAPDEDRAPQAAQPVGEGSTNIEDHDAAPDENRALQALKALSVLQLKAALKEMGLPTSGRKADLVQLLADADYRPPTPTPGNQSRRPAESKGKVKFPTELPLFILMCFNLVARAATVTAVRSEHIDWAGQWLLIGIAKSKRQTHLVGWWFHCIANKFMPSVCVVLAMALHFVCNPHLSASNVPIFHTSKAKNKGLSSLFGKLAKFCGVFNVVAHSIRKCGLSRLTTGVVDCVNQMAANIRARWQMGDINTRVNKIYVGFHKASDQYCARLLALLSLGASFFLAAPPHFKINTEGEYSQLVMNSIAILWPVIALEGIRNAAPFFLASLVHHYAWLKNTLDESHPLWRSAFKELDIHALTAELDTGKSRFDCEEGAFKAMVVDKKVDDLALAVKEIAEQGRENKEQIQTLVQGVNGISGSLAIGNMAAHGAMIPDPSNMEAFTNRLAEEVAQRMIAQGSLSSGPVVQQGPLLTAGSFIWGGKQRAVPQSFKFTGRCDQTSLLDAWRQWCLGDVSDGVMPYHQLLIHHRDDIRDVYAVRGEGNQYKDSINKSISEMMKVCKFFEQCLATCLAPGESVEGYKESVNQSLRENKIDEAVSLVRSTWDALWVKAEPLIDEGKEQGPPRTVKRKHATQSLYVRTVYKRLGNLAKKRKRQQEEQQLQQQQQHQEEEV